MLKQLQFPTIYQSQSFYITRTILNGLLYTRWIYSLHNYTVIYSNSNATQTKPWKIKQHSLAFYFDDSSYYYETVVPTGDNE